MNKEIVSELNNKSARLTELQSFLQGNDDFEFIHTYDLQAVLNDFEEALSIARMLYLQTTEKMSVVTKYAVKNEEGKYLQKKGSSNYVWSDLTRGSLYIRKSDAENKAKYRNGRVVPVKIEEVTE